MKHLITRLRIAALRKGASIRATRIALAARLGDHARVQSLTPGLMDMQGRLASLEKALG